MSDSGKRGPYAKTADQRRRIVDAAVEVFGRRGNRGSSLREIADNVGMSQAGILHHFGSKDELLMAVLAHRDDVDPEVYSAAHGAVALRDLLARARANAGMTQLFATISAEATDPEHPAHDFIVERYRRTLGVFEGAVDASKGTGEIDASVDSEAVGRLLIAAMDGLQLQGLLEDDVDVLAPFDLLLTALERFLPPVDSGVDV